MKNSIFIGITAILFIIIIGCGKIKLVKVEINEETKKPVIDTTWCNYGVEKDPDNSGNLGKFLCIVCWQEDKTCPQSQTVSLPLGNPPKEVTLALKRTQQTEDCADCKEDGLNIGNDKFLGHFRKQ